MAFDASVGGPIESSVPMSEQQQCGPSVDAPSGPASYAKMLAQVVVRTRTDLDVSRHLVNGQPQYVLRDEVSFQSRAMSNREYRIYASLDGEHTCEDNFKRLVAKGLLTEADEEEYYSFLLALHQRGILDLPISNGKQLYERYEKRKQKARRSFALQLMCWKQSLGNPDGFLTRLTPALRWLFTWQATIVWLVINAFAVVAVAQRWDELVSPLGSMLAERNLLLLLGILCVLKAWHEVGHGVACKVWGGHVPDYGVLLIVGTPCAYVDASCAWSMPSRWRRFVISMAGMYFESFVAIVSVAVWIFAEDPWLRSFAHHTIVLSTLTTVLFNANPLMKFDGYFVVSDLLDIPNLRSRADECWKWVLKRFVLGVKTSAPDRSLTRVFWLSTFGVLAGLYRIVIVIGIVGLLMWRIPVVGFLIAMAYIGFSGYQQLAQIAKYLWKHPETQGMRRQAVMVTCAVVCCLIAGLFLPITHTVTLSGVTGFEREVMVRGASDGILRSKNFMMGEQVPTGAILGEMDHPGPRIDLARGAAEEGALRLQLRDAVATGNADASQYALELTSSRATVGLLRERERQLAIKVPESGVLVEWGDGVEVGGGVADGQIVARLGCGAMVMRVLSGQRGLQEYHPVVGEAVTVVFPWDWKTQYPGEIIRVSRSSKDHVEDIALTQMGGGDIEVSPIDMTPTEDVYSIDVKIASPPLEATRSGTRGFVRLSDRQESVASWLWYRWLDFYREFLREQSA